MVICKDIRTTVCTGLEPAFFSGDVLLFEPGPRASIALSRILTKHGYAVTAVYSQDELHDALRLGGFDLAVLSGELHAGTIKQSISLAPEFGEMPVFLLRSDIDEVSLVDGIRTSIRSRPKPISSLAPPSIASPASSRSASR